MVEKEGCDFRHLDVLVIEGSGELGASSSTGGTGGNAKQSLLQLFSKLNLFRSLCTLRNSHRKYIHLNPRFIQEAILTTEK